jgi:predicted CXXCH cytochrome family protein
VHASDHESLLNDAPGKLCLTCHEQIFPEGTNASLVHSPVVDGDCLSCHRGHSSTENSLLVKPGELLCFECHERQDYAEGVVAHPPAAQGLCLTCHNPHKSTEGKLLVEKEEKLCVSCHNSIAEEKGLYSLHTPFNRGNCSGCHLPHQGGETSLLKFSLSDGALCLSCHDQLAEMMAKPGMHAPFANGECSECHFSHAGDFMPVLQKPGGELCLGCHDEIKQKLATDKVKHQPFAKLDCGACHSGHGSTENKANLFLAKMDLCLKCHGHIDKDWQNGVAHPPAQEDCGTCHDPHSSMFKNLLADNQERICGDCHQVDSADPAKAHRFLKSQGGSCLNCHNPHGGESEAMLHPESHKPFREGKCTPCHNSGRR